MTYQLAEAVQADRSEAPVRGSILIVDDDPVLSEVLSARLSRQRFRVLSAGTGAEGLAIARSDKPDLVLLDLGLPDCDGLVICRELTDSLETCHIPVIILSGLEGDDVVRRCRAAGSRYFLRKPYDPNALLLLIRDALSCGGIDAF